MDLSSTPLQPIPLAAERSRRLIVAVIVVFAVLVIAVAVFAFGGQIFGADPMTGT